MWHLNKLFPKMYKTAADVNNILERRTKRSERRVLDLLKGCQRRIVKISGIADSVFEEAYFILKPEREGGEMSEREMIAEANRIIRESSSDDDRRLRKSVRLSLGAFLVLTGISLITTVASILLLLTRL